ncbi:MAG TPA: protein kinase [Planctomycetota bacterium]|nr:protein kinase [Planctomycetota bacterium]
MADAVEATSAGERLEIVPDGRAPGSDPTPAVELRGDGAAIGPEERAWEEFLDRVLHGESKDVDELLARHAEAPGPLRERLHALGRMLARDERTAPIAPVDLASDGVLPFERLGDFRLLRRLGQGGMGIVFLAEQESLRRLVALKVIQPAQQGSREAQERFRREARAIARLRHPNIVTVFATGEDQGVLFLAMELAPGQGLDEVLADSRTRNVRPEVPAVLRWIADVARALDAAHQSGLIHRDVNPSNIRISTEGRALLVDFGLARVTDTGSLTHTEGFFGTPRYASPEQVAAKGGDLDPRTDVYSLGVTLYECVTGSVPFAGKTTHQLFHQVLTKDPRSPRSLNPSVSRDLETVILRALEKDRDQRYPTAGALADDLEALLEVRPIRARPTGPVARGAKWIRRNPGLAIAACTTLGAALWILTTTFDRRRTTRRAFESAIVAAEAARASGNYEAALSAFDRALGVRPGDREVLRKKDEAALERNLAGARGEIERAHALLYQYRNLRATLVPVRLRLLGAKTRAESEYVSPVERQTEYADQKAAARIEGEIEETYLSLLDSLAIARRMAGSDPGTADHVSDVYAGAFFEKWREAVEAGDEGAAEVFRRKVLEGDRLGRWREKIEGTGTIALAGTPEGAEVFCFRFEPLSRSREGGGGRLVPVPFPLGGEGPESRGSELPGGAEGGPRPGDVLLAVDSVESGSPSARAGLRRGDLVRSVAGAPIEGGGGQETIFAADVRPGGPAGKGGVVAFDRLVRVAGRKIDGEFDVEQSYENLRTGEAFEATFEGGGREKRVPCAKAGKLAADLGCGLLAAERALVELPIPHGGVALRISSGGAEKEVTLSGGGFSGLRVVRTASPLLCGARNRVGLLPIGSFRAPPGSYLFLLRMEGYDDLRLPLLHAVDEKSEVRVQMLPEGTTPPGFVWIPPGRFVVGGDPEAPRSTERGVRELGGFWIARTETTVGEYLEFLNDPAVLSTIEKTLDPGAGIRIPRISTFRDAWRRGDRSVECSLDPRWPVFGVGWEDAVAFGQWRTEKARARGERWSYELPTEEEWEKAARGVDGRKFPWGDAFDWDSVMGGLSRPEVTRPEPVARFIRGESPWGLEDMAGGAMEWCAGWVREGEVHPQRGGAWAEGSIQFFRSASRGPRHTTSLAGFRLVARRGSRE